MGAIFSGCRRYRYVLDRELAPSNNKALVCIGLNPSVADETKPDPTITRLLVRAGQWNCSYLIMLNLFAFVSTDPDGMPPGDDAIGPNNDEHIWSVLCQQYRDHILLVGWGADKHVGSRDREVYRFLKREKLDIFCLGKNKNGSPKHPLYVGYAKSLEPWSMQL